MGSVVLCWLLCEVWDDVVMLVLWVVVEGACVTVGCVHVELVVGGGVVAVECRVAVMVSVLV